MNYLHSGHSNLPLPKRDRIWRYSNLSSIKYKPLGIYIPPNFKGSNLALIANEYAKGISTSQFVVTGSNVRNKIVVVWFI